MLDWADPAVSIPVAVVIGLIIGSFLNVVIARLPIMLEREWRSECRELLAEEDASGTADDAERFTLVSPRSCCPRCHSPVRALDNVPVLSWLVLRGRCRSCGASISIQYPLVEALTAVLTVLVILRFGVTPYGLLAILFTWVLVPAAVIDLRTTLLPDNLTLPLLWLGLAAAAADVSPMDPADAIIGAAAGYLIL